MAIAVGVLWNIDLWCNGNTAGFGPVIRGSNPRGSTNKQFFEDIHYNDICGVSKGIDGLIYRILIAQGVEYLRRYISKWAWE